MTDPPVDGDGTGTGGTSRAGRRSTVASLAVTVAVLALGGWYVGARWEEVSMAVGRIGVLAAVGCTLLTGLGVLATGECWRVWLASLARPPGVVTAHAFFYLTQSGKYLPGSLWPLLAQATLARRYGVPRTAVLSATSLFLVTHVVTGVAVGIAGVGVVASAGWAWLLYPAAALGLLALSPPVLRRVMAVADRRRGLATTSPTPSWTTVGAAAALMFLAWLCYGLATWLLVARLEPDPATAPLVVGTYALAWVVGFLAVAAPAGIGAREAVVTALLGPVLGVAAALSVALVSRVALTVVDLGLAAVSAGLLRRPVPANGSARG